MEEVVYNELTGYLMKILLAVIIILILNYNRVIKQENKIKNLFSSIDIILQKRYDLIPNLVTVVKQYMKYEKELLEEITKIRSGNLSKNEVVKMNDDITEKVNEIYLQVENYPQLKADEVFNKLTKNLISIENELAAARRVYNSTVTNFNTLISVFPNNILAKLMGKKEYQLFEKEVAVIKPEIKMDE